MISRTRRRANFEIAYLKMQNAIVCIFLHTHKIQLTIPFGWDYSTLCIQIRIPINPFTSTADICMAILLFRASHIWCRILRIKGWCAMGMHCHAECVHSYTQSLRTVKTSSSTKRNASTKGCTCPKLHVLLSLPAFVHEAIANANECSIMESTIE